MIIYVLEQNHQYSFVLTTCVCGRTDHVTSESRDKIWSRAQFINGKINVYQCISMNVKVFCSLGGAEFFSRWLVSNLFSEKTEKMWKVTCTLFFWKSIKNGYVTQLLVFENKVWVVQKRPFFVDFLDSNFSIFSRPFSSCLRK